MKKILIAIFALLCASPAAVQTISGCGTQVIAKASNGSIAKLTSEADCFAKAKAVATTAEQVRRDRIVALTPKPAPTPTPTPTPIPTPSPSTLSGVVSEGDSISIFWGGSYPGLYATSHLQVKFNGIAVGGARIGGTENSLEGRLPKLLALHPAIVTVLIGANDLGDGQYPSTDAWLNALWGYVAKVKASGAKVAVGTVLPICASAYGDYGTRTNQRRVAANEAIRAAVGTKIDAVIDFAADPDIGDDAAACDKAWFKDGLHPSDGGPAGTGGEGRMFTIYAPVVDRLLASAPTPTPEPQPMTVTPIASNFDRKAWIVTGYDHGLPGNLPPSNRPDDVGAFRFLCTPGQMSWDDPILYPGVKNGSAHLHQFYGNTLADWRSTYATLRTTGDSTCSNQLNRSAYWVPALMNAAGQVIRPDYMSIYYKREQDAPDCGKPVALKGCADIPTGLRVVSGYDMKRIGEKQEENMTFSFRCIANQINRQTLAEAVADCGGAGQIIAAIGFGNCWTGTLDSADHRSHVNHVKYGQDGVPRCDADHPYLIPELTQQIAYTITREDGAIWFSSDRMNGMTMPGGSTFHADYMEGWDPQTRDTWHRNCIGKLLNCSDGELGDGTMLKRGPLTYAAAERLVAPPARP